MDWSYTEIECGLYRQMPLSAEAGANQVNSQDHPETASEPSIKKSKAFEKGKTGVGAKKRSLKRL